MKTLHSLLLASALGALSFAPNARAVLTNTARAIIAPNFSGGGGPIDNIVHNAGPVDATGSSTGGFSSSGSATAHTNYGLIKATANAVGSLHATGSGTINDSLTITAPGVPMSTQGTLTYSVTVSGGMSASAGFSAASWGLQTDLGGGFYDITKSAHFNSSEVAPAGYGGDPFGTYSATITFQFGFAMTLDVEMSATGSASYGNNGAGAAAIAPYVRVLWNGITDIKVNGTPIANATVSSVSGTNWAAPATDCPSDLNGDNQVDDSDFVLFVVAYNILDCADPTMPAGCPADLNGDHLVDDSDFVAFVAAYNELVCP
ncbi:MAG: hypothetical protein ACREJD_10370 [Phycisphaerales bacterium]